VLGRSKKCPRALPDVLELNVSLDTGKAIVQIDPEIIGADILQKTVAISTSAMTSWSLRSRSGARTRCRQHAVLAVRGESRHGRDTILRRYVGCRHDGGAHVRKQLVRSRSPSTLQGQLLPVACVVSFRLRVGSDPRFGRRMPGDGVISTYSPCH